MYRLCRIKGHTFLKHALPESAVVLDLGANHGEFAHAVADRLGATVYAVEPTTELIVGCQAHPRVRVLHAAVCAEDGSVPFFLSDNPEMSSLNVLNASQHPRHVIVPGRTLESITREFNLDRVDLLKVDIEGGEIAMLDSVSDETLSRISQISIEFHDFTGAITLTDIERAVKKLEFAGFQVVRFSHSNMDWLFFHPQRCRVGSLSTLWMRHVHRNARFIWRNTVGHAFRTEEVA